MINKDENIYRFAVRRAFLEREIEAKSMTRKALYENHGFLGFTNQQGRKRPLDTPEKKEREKREGERQRRRER